MSGKSFRLSDWPYFPGKAAKLIAISKPYWEGTQYWVNLQFFPNLRDHYKLPFTDLTMLIRDSKYIDGYFQGIDKANTASLDLRFSESKRPIPYPPKENRKLEDQFESYTFGFPFQGNFYVLPLEVLVRDVLAPDGEMLNLITALDMKDKKFLFEMINGVINIKIMSDVPYAYSKNRGKMIHIAWLFSNPMIEKMFTQAFENIRDGNGILFDWCFDRLKCNVTYETNPKGIRFIKSIISFTKKINALEIHVDDPRDSNQEAGEQDESERAKPVPKDAKKLVSHGKGKVGDLGHWAPNPVTVTYESLPKYVREKHSARKARTTSISKDKIAEVGNGRRTTGDHTGQKSIPKLIFKQHDTLNDNSTFSEISEALLALQGNENIEKLPESYIAQMCLHTDTGLFRYLCDGITERCYFAGKITFKDGKEAVVLELEREKRKISMLILISNNKCEWDGVIHEIMRCTVEESGKWPTEILNSLCNSFLLRIDRCKHTNIDSEQLAKKILHKCHTGLFSI